MQAEELRRLLQELSSNIKTKSLWVQSQSHLYTENQDNQSYVVSKQNKAKTNK